MPIRLNDLPVELANQHSRGCLWVLVAATSLGLQAPTTPSEHGLKFVDNLFGGIGL